MNDITAGLSGIHLTDLDEERRKLLESSSIMSIETGEAMKRHFKDTRCWPYPDILPLNAAYGPFVDFPRGGRDRQMHLLWEAIINTNASEDKTKCEVLCLHGSPGIGKTYVLQQLYSKKDNDIPEHLKPQGKLVKFLALDLSRNACSEINCPSFMEVIDNHPNLFAMSRLFWVNFADQNKLTWRNFFEMVVVRLIRANLSAPLLELMERYLKKLKIGKKCVILVDEIMKTCVLGDTFGGRARSSICSWMDNKLCDGILFSSLDVQFMTDERTYSGRPVRFVTTLPLLKVDESVPIFRAMIRSSFVDDGGNPVNSEQVYEMFALVTGGHPRSIEYIIEKCNLCDYPAKQIPLMTIIKEAAESLCSAYKNVSNWKRLFELVLLPKKVNKEGRLDDHPTSEMYRMLVMNGILVDSFDDNDSEFVPTVPELFLHKWIQKRGPNCLGNEPRNLLNQILRLRSSFTALKYEILHSSWEMLMRHIRQCDKFYERIPLNVLYQHELRSNSTPAASCHVNGSSILREILYKDTTIISISPNEIYNPSNVQNPGWNRMVVMEVFPLKSKNKRDYLLPVFIQTVFCADSSTSNLSKEKILEDLEICHNFFKKYVKIDNAKFRFISSKRKWFTSKPKPVESDFILLYVGIQKTNDNTLRDAPPNVMFCLGQNLQNLYGPTLMNFVDG